MTGKEFIWCHWITRNITHSNILIEIIPVLLVSMMMTGCGGTPLMLAAEKGDIQKAERIIATKDVDVNERGFMELSALHYAVGSGKADMVRLLIEKGANVNARDQNGDTALHYAVSREQEGIVRLLIEKGADPGMAGFKGLTPLRIAEERGNSAIVRILKKSVADDPVFGKQTPQVARPARSGPTEQPLLVKSDIDELPLFTANSRKNSYAVVIGIEMYRQKLPKADFAVADAKIVTEYLTKVMGYPEENVVTLANEQAAKSDFEKYFEKWLFNNVEKDSTVFIYYSGHGAPSATTGNAYLVPYDGDPSFIEQTGYPLKRLYESLSKLQAKEIIVAIDSCFSGAGGRSVIAKGARPIVLTIDNPVLLSKNMTVLSASSGDQTSSTYDEKGHGLFTYFMLEAIKNENVMKQDGSIDIGSLFDYIKPQVSNIARKKFNNEQTPQFIGQRGQR